MNIRCEVPDGCRRDVTHCSEVTGQFMCEEAASKFPELAPVKIEKVIETEPEQEATA